MSSSSFVHRPILISDAGAVVSGHHKASEAGAAVLRQGGNAMDAAVAASAMLCVAIPHMNGVGGDAIGLYYEARSGRVTAVNGTGRAPHRATAALSEAGLSHMPRRGPHTVSVFGLVDAWQRCLERFGSRPLADLLLPAAELAERGAFVDLNLQTFFGGSAYAELAAQFPALTELYGAPGERRIGTRLPNKPLAETLHTLRREGAAALYKGDLGRRLLADLAAAGVPIDAEDLSRHETQLAEPVSTPFLGRMLHVAPPNSQGIALTALAVLSEARRARGKGEVAFQPDWYLPDKLVAFMCRDRFCGDPHVMPRPDALLNASTLAEFFHQKTAPAPLQAAGGDTSTLVVVDRWGNAVSWVQSLFEEFGSGVVSPATGIVVHNRLALQQLGAPGPLALESGRRPFHTLCPALLTGDTGCEVAIATPGDHGQPQTLFQVLVRLLVEGCNLQAAIEAPRLRHDAGREVMIEDRAPASWSSQIESAGYAVRAIGSWSRLAGGVNAIQRAPDGVLLAGADPRRASYAIASD